MDSNIAIHETAFVTSTFRAYNEPLSQDPFAKLWRNKKTETWIARYLDEVSQEEPLCKKQVFPGNHKSFIQKKQNRSCNKFWLWL